MSLNPVQSVPEFTWKPPVSRPHELPLGGNRDGDLREVAQGRVLYAWSATNGKWEGLASINEWPKKDTFSWGGTVNGESELPPSTSVGNLLAIYKPSSAPVLFVWKGAWERLSFTFKVLVEEAPTGGETEGEKKPSIQSVQVKAASVQSCRVANYRARGGPFPSSVKTKGPPTKIVPTVERFVGKGPVEGRGEVEGEQGKNGPPIVDWLQNERQTIDWSALYVGAGVITSFAEWLPWAELIAGKAELVLAQEFGFRQSAAGVAKEGGELWDMHWVGKPEFWQAFDSQRGPTQAGAFIAFIEGDFYVPGGALFLPNLEARPSAPYGFVALDENGNPAPLRVVEIPQNPTIQRVWMLRQEEETWISWSNKWISWLSNDSPDLGGKAARAVHGTKYTAYGTPRQTESPEDIEYGEWGVIFSEWSQQGGEPDSDNLVGLKPYLIDPSDPIYEWAKQHGQTTGVRMPLDGEGVFDIPLDGSTPGWLVWGCISEPGYAALADDPGITYTNTFGKITSEIHVRLAPRGSLSAGTQRASGIWLPSGVR
jgi:hypothetical protein